MRRPTHPDTICAIGDFLRDKDLACSECGRWPADGCTCPDAFSEDSGAEHQAFVDEIGETLRAYMRAKGCADAARAQKAEALKRVQRLSEAVADAERESNRFASALSADALQLLASAGIVKIDGAYYTVDTSQSLRLVPCHPLEIG